MAKRKLRAKIGDLRQCVPVRFNHHHAVMVGEILAHVDYLTATIGRLDTRVEGMVVPFRAARELLTTIPGIQQRDADYLANNDNPDRRRRHLVNQLEHLGYTVELTSPA